MSIDTAALRADLMNNEARILTDDRGVAYVGNPDGKALVVSGTHRVAFSLGHGLGTVRHLWCRLG